MQLASASPALLGAMLALALSSGAAPAQMPMPMEGVLTFVSATLGGSQPEPLAPVTYHDVRLQHMVQQLEQESPAAADMLLAIRRAGFPLSFGTFDDLAQEMEQEYRSWTRSSRSAAGYMAPVVRPGPAFSGVLTTQKINVAVNLDMMDELFEGAPTAVPDARVDWAEIRRLETLAVLAHEIVHAYGLAMSGGDPRFGCHDPAEDERPEDSCVMLGENTVRREIGAPLDWDYGFPSAPSLAKRYGEHAERRAELLEMGSVRLPFELAPKVQLPVRRPLN